MTAKHQLFVTGTGTDVGKTVVTAGIAATALRAGVSTAAFKPIQTGVAEGETDLDVIRSLVPGLVPLDDAVLPFQFAYPASPHLAARLENAEIDPDAVIDAVNRAAKLATADLLLIEGAGGVLAPIRGDFTMLSLMKNVDAPVVVVADAGLGTINHTLLTLRALRGENVEIAGVIVNKTSPSPDAVELDNLDVIKSIGNVPVLARMEQFDDAKRHFETKSGTLFVDDELLKTLILQRD